LVEYLKGSEEAIFFSEEKLHEAVRLADLTVRSIKFGRLGARSSETPIFERYVIGIFMSSNQFNTQPDERIRSVKIWLLRFRFMHEGLKRVTCLLQNFRMWPFLAPSPSIEASNFQNACHYNDTSE
jgi:hypothetical protein